MRVNGATDHHPRRYPPVPHGDWRDRIRIVRRTPDGDGRHRCGDRGGHRRPVRSDALTMYPQPIDSVPTEAHNRRMTAALLTIASIVPAWWAIAFYEIGINR